MHFPRAAGLLLHPTSLPNGYGNGDLGPEAFQFVDFLESAGQRIWQILPLGPTGYADSPYQCFSAFAGNPLLLSLDALVERGSLLATEVSAATFWNLTRVDFGHTIPRKYALLRLAAKRFFAGAQETEEFDTFCQANAWWLTDFARFQALKVANGMVAWTQWQTDKFDPEEEAAQRFWQFEFFRQWKALKTYANSRGVKIMGDIPIYVAMDSAEVWAHPEFFRLDVVAVVPPDYFSATGQLWGNPIYRWDRMAEDGYSWWIRRFSAVLELVDMVRLDHFRGFYKYWQVPATAETAIDGEWLPGPGAPLFRAVHAALGDLPVVAENLGVITPEVEAIRNEFALPGMRILQFAFGNDPQGPSFRPHNYEPNTVAYTGTHDNDTTLGWWHSKPGGASIRTAEDIALEQRFALDYLGTDGKEMHWSLIRAIFASVANTAIVPVQDVLGLGGEARMNVPGTTTNNWQWRLTPGALGPTLAARLRKLAELYDR